MKNPNRNYEKLHSYIWEVQNTEREKFKKDFQNLPRKLQFFIIRLVGEHNRLESEQNKSFVDLKTVISWFDAYLILNYSEHKITFYVTELYLKN